MNNTTEFGTVEVANLVNADGWLDMAQAIAEAKCKSKLYGHPAFVCQTGHNNFNYRFMSHDDSCGVLIARFDANGDKF